MLPGAGEPLRFGGVQLTMPADCTAGDELPFDVSNGEETNANYGFWMQYGFDLRTPVYCLAISGLGARVAFLGRLAWLSVHKEIGCNAI